MDTPSPSTDGDAPSIWYMQNTTHCHTGDSLHGEAAASASLHEHSSSIIRQAIHLQHALAKDQLLQEPMQDKQECV